MDNLSIVDRHKCMSRIRSKNTQIEKTLFRILRKKKIHFQKHYKTYGKPDIAFPSIKVAVFLDSEYWHGWRFSSWAKRLPTAYWREKIAGNIRRDKRNRIKLKKEGWTVLRFWGHQITNDPEQCASLIINKVREKKRCQM